MDEGRKEGRRKGEMKRRKKVGACHETERSDTLPRTHERPPDQDVDVVFVISIAENNDKT